MALQEWTEEQKMVQETVRDFAAEQLAPRAAHVDETREFNVEAFRSLAELGLLGIPVPETYGGAGADFVSTILAIEELGRGCASTALAVAAHTSMVIEPILRLGHDAQKEALLSELASGKKLGAAGFSGLSGQGPGLPPQVAARQDGEGYLLEGSERLCVNASLADIFVCPARLEGEGDSARLALFLLQKGRAGMTVGDRQETMGMRGAEVCELVFKDCHVAGENMLGGREEEEALLTATLHRSRLALSALATGIGQASLEAAAPYVMERSQFGRPLGTLEAIQAMIADMATELQAARLLIMHATRLADAGKPFGTESAMAKLFASEMVTRVTFNAVQAFGGYGYMAEYPVERYYRDGGFCSLVQGTSAVQRLTIARDVLGLS